MGEGRERRPPRRGRPDRDRNEGGDPRERINEMFKSDMETRIKYFMTAEDKELEFEPMNSFKRRLIHEVARPYNLETASRGEEPNRYVCLIKTKESKIPEKTSMPRLWDFGNQTFPINPGKDGVQLVLKTDGSLELGDDENQRNVVDSRLVTAKEVRIRGGKIVQPGDPTW